MKICNKCKKDKEFDEFHNSKATKDGKRIECKECIKTYQEKYKKREGYKEKKKVQDKLYQEINKDKIKEQRKLYNLKNPNRQKEYNKKNLNKNNLAQKIKYHKDPNYKIRKNITTRIFIEIKGKVKKLRTLELLGCSIEECKQHIEKQFLPEFNWKNWGKVWELDHKIGCCNFDLTNLEQQKQCFHYTNLRPIFKTTQIAEQFGYIDQIGNRNRSKYEK